ncbi:DNA alkylation repair protein [Clostridium oryzae]|uniref:DNA alkylation repair enzyme n=1 Tax=Clostridium oryzae TaxID=1450648 RepID=A0A1V4IPJ4_9CLOT|nr:DNA alkylation repair protein [Clostridium oryzae]OPJ61932.1 DNA alkylation repair enzyme [Clostridium oryzae]
MNDDIRISLFNLCDEKYKTFQMKLCPDNKNIIGVRLPALRKIAKSIAKGKWKEYLKSAQNDYFEEIMLQGMVIGYIDVEIEERLKLITYFVPKIDNWSVCDSFCSGLKFVKKSRECVWEYLETYINSKEDFRLRFAIVMMIFYFIEDEYIDRVLQIVDGIKHEGYYVKMAVAWAVSICYVKFPEKTMEYLKNNSLDDFTYNKSLQKIIESFQVDKDTKTLIGRMKRNLTRS